jgi:hypothetical protein
MAVALEGLSLNWGLSSPRILIRGEKLMVAANSNYRNTLDGSNPVQGSLVRVQHYSDERAEVSREEFLLEVARRFTARPPLTEEDIRLHVWLMERLEAINHERRGLWPRLRRLLFGSRSDV